MVITAIPSLAYSLDRVTHKFGTAMAIPAVGCYGHKSYLSVCMHESKVGSSNSFSLVAEIVSPEAVVSLMAVLLD